MKEKIKSPNEQFEFVESDETMGSADRDILKLEEDLEDIKDELSDTKRKLQKKSEEARLLQQSLDGFENENKKLKRYIDEALKEQEKLKGKLSLNNESLSFVQEILSAKEFSSQNVNKLKSRMDLFEAFIKGHFMDLNAYLFRNFNLKWNEIAGRKGFEEKKEYFFNAFDQWAASKRKSWLYQKTTIAFVGEFSAGKTSIVNRILSQDDPSIALLPVDAKAATAIPTYIVGGETTLYTFISRDSKQKRIHESTFKKVSKEILGEIKGVSSLIQYFVMTHKTPSLNGLTILDTPGFNSNDNDDKDRTLEVINECDALFWVLDINVGDINKTSIDLIKEYLKKPLYVVINKVDTKSESEINRVEKKIKDSFKRNGLSVEGYIQFSTKHPLEYIMRPIHSVNRIALRDTFVNDVKVDIENLLKWFAESEKAANDKYNNACHKGENLDDSFKYKLRALSDDCSTASDMPKWVKHRFSKDRYEMNSVEGRRLQDLLDKISSGSIPRLLQAFENRIDNAELIERSFQDLCIIRGAIRMLNECQQQYEKIAKLL